MREEVLRRGEWVKDRSGRGGRAEAVIFGLTCLLVSLDAGLGAMFISGRGGLAGRFSPAPPGGGEESTVPAVTFSQVSQEMAKRELLEAPLF